MLYGDNKACLAIANNPVHHKYTKHIDIRLHFVRELIQREKLDVAYVDTASNVADIFTKGLGTQPFRLHRDALFGLREIRPLDSGNITHYLRDYIDLDDPDLITEDMRALTALLDDAEFHDATDVDSFTLYNSSAR